MSCNMKQKYEHALHYYLECTSEHNSNCINLTVTMTGIIYIYNIIWSKLTPRTKLLCSHIALNSVACETRIIINENWFRILVSQCRRQMEDYRLYKVLSHLKHIGDDKQVGKHPPLCSNCKQSNDPSEAHERNKDDSGLDQTPVHGQVECGLISSYVGIKKTLYNSYLLSITTYKINAYRLGQLLFIQSFIHYLLITHVQLGG